MKIITILSSIGQGRGNFRGTITLEHKAKVYARANKMNIEKMTVVSEGLEVILSSKKTTAAKLNQLCHQLDPINYP